MTNRETYTKNIASAIVLLRTRAGLTQSELAEKLNYSDKAVSKWERAESLPDAIVLKQIADLFGVSLDSMFDAEKTEKEVEKPQVQTSNLKLFGIDFGMSLRHFAITLLSVIAVWFVALLAFVVLKYTLPEEEKTFWLCFMAAVPVSCIVLVVFNSLWGSRLVNKIWISLLIWTALAFIFLLVLTVFDTNIWMIFLLGIPAEAALPIWHWLEWLVKKKK